MWLKKKIPLSPISHSLQDSNLLLSSWRRESLKTCFAFTPQTFHCWNWVPFSDYLFLKSYRNIFYIMAVAMLLREFLIVGFYFPAKSGKSGAKVFFLLLCQRCLKRQNTHVLLENGSAIIISKLPSAVMFSSSSETASACFAGVQFVDVTCTWWSTGIFEKHCLVN